MPGPSMAPTTAMVSFQYSTVVDSTVPFTLSVHLAQALGTFGSVHACPHVHLLMHG